MPSQLFAKLYIIYIYDIAYKNEIHLVVGRAENIDFVLLVQAMA